MPKSNPSLPLDGYAPVADRITLFYEKFPEGRIITELVSSGQREVIFKALVYRAPNDANPAATGWASEREGDGEVNAVACLENAETSAIGRALANLGFTASRRRPSYEEMQKVDRARRRIAAPPPPARVASPIQAAMPPSRRAPAAAAPLPLPPKRSPEDDARRDVEELLTTAELAGFSSARGRIIRAELTRPDGGNSARRVERLLRGWLARNGV